MITFDQSRISESVSIPNLNDWLNQVGESEGFSVGEISIILGSDEWLLEYNKQYLDHDYYTDIITFDYVESNVISGDLLISFDRVVDNSLTLNVSRETELCRVVVHGFLHLCGYGDKTVSEKELMRKKEDYYLNLL
tara:strand:+ start:124724 stop:125131 length:408 start_codon:yes stop_codon:yes gene_type:complete